MMGDKELLELAARAAGYTVVRWSDDGDALLLEGVQEPWSPLTDDGDAFRLAVKLHLALMFPMKSDKYKQCGAGQVGCETPGSFEPHDPDPYAATRRAITRAAAAIAQERGGNAEVSGDER